MIESSENSKHKREYLTKVITAFLRLTKSLPESLVDDKQALVVDIDYNLVFPHLRGFSDSDLLSIAQTVFPDITQFNQTFHKSWQKIVDSSDAELWREAAKHYFSTYGIKEILRSTDNIDFEEFFVQLPHGFIPAEVFLPPQYTKFRMIGVVTDTGMQRLLQQIFYGNIALSEQSLRDYLVIADFLGFRPELEQVKNRELLTRYQAEARIIPEQPVEIMRLLIFLTTDSTLLIQSHENLQQILNKARTNSLAVFNHLFIKDILTERTEQLASVFYRYKKLFLAMRRLGLAKEVNRIHRLASKFWQPYPATEFFTTKVLRNQKLDLVQELQKYDISDLVKIYNKLNYVFCSSAALDNQYFDNFTIRNGKIFTKLEAISITNSEVLALCNEVCTQIKKLLKQRLNPDEKVKLIEPQNLVFSFPTSEKSFIGELPLYTQTIALNQAHVIGVAWEENDVDLSALLATGVKVGWNGEYKADNNQVLYSGDCTWGGAEALYFDTDIDAIIMINLYNFEAGEMDLFMSSESKLDFEAQEDRKYIVNPNKLIFSSKIEAKRRSQVLGVYHRHHGKTRFTFANLSQGNSRASTVNRELDQVLITTINLRGNSCLKLRDVFGAADGDNNQAADIYDLREASKAKIIKLCFPEE